VIRAGAERETAQSGLPSPKCLASVGDIMRHSNSGMLVDTQRSEICG
jgi:hypothetical protein